jgi:hypothetical protein
LLFVVVYCHLRLFEPAMAHPQAKEARLAEALKQRKKAKKAAAAAAAALGSGGLGGAAGHGGHSADAALLANENTRLREREQALMDAVRLPCITLRSIHCCGSSLFCLFMFVDGYIIVSLMWLLRRLKNYQIKTKI